MKLTFWQQFGSNHSGGFTVVGRFESSEKVHAAATQLDTMLKNVFRRYEEHSEENHLDMYDPPSPPERELMEKFNIQTKWNLGLSPRDVRQSLSVQALDRIVLLNIRDTSWNHSHENLSTSVSRLGSLSTGQHWVMEDVFTPGLFIKLSAHALDEIAGKHVYDEIRMAMDKAEPEGDVVMVHIELPWLYGCYAMDHDVQWDGGILTITGLFHFLSMNLSAFISHLQAEGFSEFDIEFNEIVV